MFMRRFKCKICRRLGQSVCSRKKCAILRRPYVPGMQAKKRRGTVSEYGIQLREKQKLKNYYALKEKQFKRYIKKASSRLERGEDIEYCLINELEHRLDNIVFRLGFASTRFQARQFISHGHFYVNGQKINIPSYKVKEQQTIQISPFKKDKIIHQNNYPYLKEFKTLSWLVFDTKTMAGQVISKISLEELALPVDLPKIFAFYNR